MGKEISKIERTGNKTAVRDSKGNTVQHDVLEMTVINTSKVTFNIQQLLDRKSLLEADLAEVNDLISRVQAMEDEDNASKNKS